MIPGSRTSVLLADDHRMVLDCLVRHLQKDFHIVGTALDGRSLIEMARQTRPEGIVTDLAQAGYPSHAASSKGTCKRQHSRSDGALGPVDGRGSFPGGSVRHRAQGL